MFSAHGWIRVRSSREAFVEGMSYDNIDEMDEEIDRADNQLWDELEDHLSKFGNKPKPYKPDGLDIEICDIGLSMINGHFIGI